jgi:hypothetical protein
MLGAKDLLRIAEAQDHYLARCAASPLNAEARSGYIYAPSFLGDSDTERLTTIVRSLDLLRETDTVILSASADNGYPHTRPKALICLPAGHVRSSTDAALKETLCHEAFHINQRLAPGPWKAMCRAQGWTPLSQDEVPARFRERCRINPDTFYDTPFWAWDTHYVPLPLFKQGFTVAINDVTVEWLDRRTGALFHSPPQSFTERYGSPSQPEHPYEVYAVRFAEQGITTHAQLRHALQELATNV